LETQVDDLSGQVIGYVMDLLLAHGALDVFTQAIGMKKSRPAILITVICPCDRLEICEDILFQETTTLGIRRRFQERRIIPRQIVSIETKLGTARVKVADRDKSKTIQPEYEDCVKLAKIHQIPLSEVQAIVLQAYQEWTTKN
jgi:pyridinium-3,5-bisthiocarboxylic acid mononucleotide nickel chelatase